MMYKPDKAIHPGYTISRSLQREGMTQKSLSERTGLTEKHISKVINGEASITVETGLLLENALGGTASFWINLEKNYQETQARLERRSLLKKDLSILSDYPYAEIARCGYVVQTNNREKRVENLWKFFGVNSLQSVEQTEPVAYRKRGGASLKKGAIAAWLRCGELEAKKSEISLFSEEKLKESLNELRSLTIKDPKFFSVRAREILLNAGVALVYIPHFSGTGVSGAVRWIGDNPVVQLSIFGKYADMLWFNLFHEIGHLVLHGKKEKFIEFDDTNLSLVQEKEEEANEFAGNAFIPREKYTAFIQNGEFTKRSVAQFAKELSIHPGVVEGRLGHDNIISWKQPLGFKQRLKLSPEDE